MLSLLLSMLGCMDGQGVFAQNRTMYANFKFISDDSGPDRT